MQLRRRDFLSLVGWALAGCTANSPTSRAATSGTRPSTSETLHARRQTPEEEVTSTRPATTTTTAPPVRVIEVIERAGWGAAVAAPGMIEHTVERLTIHHTGTVLEDNRLAPSRLRDHQASHQTDRGWPDLAYHFAVDREGNIYEGRSVEFRGDTATRYDPTGHLLVVLEGNFDVEGTADPQLRSLTELLAWAAGRYSVGVETIKSHRDYLPGETACPGENLYALLESGELVGAVRSLTDELIELIYLRGEEAVARIVEIEAP